MKPLSIFSLSIFCISAQAYTLSGNVYSTNGSESDTQAAINASPNGGVVQLPAGSFKWSRGVTVKHGLTIQGEGVASTSLENAGTSYSLININCDQVETRITGIAFKGQYAINLSGSYTTAEFRIDNCTFNCGRSQGVTVQFNNNAPGLVDHCSFVGGSGSEMIHNLGFGANSNAGWLDDVYPGSASAVYIENCTFTKDPLKDSYFWGTSAIESFYGARTVIRYSIAKGCQFDQHGTAGMIGARWFEFYNNTFYTPPGMNQSNYITLRGGSGVVFNNVNTGSNATTGIIELYDENGGTYPLYLARGIHQYYSPVHLWNNSSGMPVESGSKNVILGRDFFVSGFEPSSMHKCQLTTDNANTTYSYKPYVYPHPLDDGSTSVFGPVAP
jgi:hypothetical protein